MNHHLRLSSFRTATGRLVLLVLALMLLSLPTLVLANTAGGLPYEDGLRKLTDSITGPVAFSISLIGVIAAGAALIFGGEMAGLLRTMIFLVLVIAIIVNASSLIDLVGGSSALVADVDGSIRWLLHSERTLT